jgi:hypothetical protein
MRLILDGISYKVVKIRPNVLSVYELTLSTGDVIYAMGWDLVEIEYSYGVNVLLDEFEAIFAGKGLRCDHFTTTS